MTLTPAFAQGLAAVRAWYDKLPPEDRADFARAVDDLAALAEAQVKAAADAQAQKFGGPLLGGLARGVTDAALAKLYAQLKDELAAFETRSTPSQGA